MEYYRDVFTLSTWEAFRDAGASVTAFSRNKSAAASRLLTGDQLLCYLKGKIGWVGALEVTGPASMSEDSIWGVTRFPVRVPVKPLVVLPPELMLPMSALEGRLSFYRAGMVPAMFSAHLQGSPGRMSTADGETIYKALLAHEDGVRERIQNVEVASGALEESSPNTSHSEAQLLLARWGASTGCNVWIPRADRQRLSRASRGEMPPLLEQLPYLFGGRVKTVIENIDVIWLRGEHVVAAFEVEHSTSIYSGLLRMSDLVASIPNLNISLFIVAPNERRGNVLSEITRPTFQALQTPLSRLCGFISYEKLTSEFEHLGPRLHNFRPEGIADLAEFASGAGDPPR